MTETDFNKLGWYRNPKVAADEYTHKKGHSMKRSNEGRITFYKVKNNRVELIKLRSTRFDQAFKEVAREI